jgi:hypothetical protein
MPKPLPSHIYNEDEQQISLTPELVQASLMATPREQLLEAQLRVAVRTNAKMLIKLRWWRTLAREILSELPDTEPRPMRKPVKGTASATEEALAQLARKTAALALLWVRGEPASTGLRTFVTKAMGSARKGLSATEQAAAVETLLDELAPPARGPLRKRMRLAKIAYLAFSGEPTDSKNRGLRGPIARLLSDPMRLPP